MSSIADSLSSLLAGVHLPDEMQTISDEDFNFIRELIFQEAGISLNDSKKALVASRLAKRLARLNIKSYSEYLDYLARCDPRGIERQTMVNCLTTNKTDFFREPHHFDFLRSEVFPKIAGDAMSGKPRKIRIWSSACSTGEEPYSIAITLFEHFGLLDGWDVQILASDINTEVLDTASQGIYPLGRIEGIEDEIKQKYFLRGSGDYEGFCMVRPAVRRLVHFRQINLMDAHWPIRTHFDVVFCRNVIIYFSAETQRVLLPRLVDRVIDGGYLILGHSENLLWLTDLLDPLGNTVYRRKTKDSASRIAFRTIKNAFIHDKPETPPPFVPANPTPAAEQKSPHPAITRCDIVVGESFVSRDPCIIRTLLGSCVAACLYDPEAKIGGMTHFMLPCHPTDTNFSSRYGINAMELLINSILKHGGNRQRLLAKVFGGANVMPQTKWPWNIGRKNIEFIRRFLHTDRIPIVAERLGGRKPLRVHFISNTGKAYVKEIDSEESIRQREVFVLKMAMEEVAHPHESDITLF